MEEGHLPPYLERGHRVDRRGIGDVSLLKKEQAIVQP
jgi:hypothetical protein